MLQKLGSIVFCMMVMITAPCYCMTTHTLRPGMTVEYDLPSNEPQLFVNYMFWSIDALCRVTMEDETVDLYVELLAKRGKINNRPLAAGDTWRLNVRRGEVLQLSVDSGAKFKLTNLGKKIVRTTCSSL